jgi:hypothetical protein
VSDDRALHSPHWVHTLYATRQCTMTMASFVKGTRRDGLPPPEIYGSPLGAMPQANTARRAQMNYAQVVARLSSGGTL